MCFNYVMIHRKADLMGFGLKSYRQRIGMTLFHGATRITDQ
ncbi:hypothetical protein VHA_002117 [Grimontia hollisae CIP 101886]|uniref:Uncharacterized protein n=1 Tax=Grimontia hollisae CIP 101886 TaxID=675812 RepID=D0I8P2_GRIHO|nr:hypothetical protein VHA_002117 [Grimontia hollisae CIP 101886]